MYTIYIQHDRNSSCVKICTRYILQLTPKINTHNIHSHIQVYTCIYLYHNHNKKVLTSNT